MKGAGSRYRAVQVGNDLYKVSFDKLAVTKFSKIVAVDGGIEEERKEHE